MRSVLQSIRQFLAELRRRNVYQVAVTYVVVGFFVIEGADLTLTRLGLPPWTVTLVIVLVGLGFPIALVLAWALEETPEGIRRTPRTDEHPAAAVPKDDSPNDSRAGDRSVAGLPVHSLDHGRHIWAHVAPARIFFSPTWALSA